MATDALLTAEAVRRLLDQFKPQVLLAGNPNTMEGRVAALIARERGLPVAAMEHGSIMPGHPNWQDCPADVICVWGEPSRRALLASGVDNRKITVTGSPRLDVALNRRAEAFGQNIHVGADKQAKHVLVVTSGPGDSVSFLQHETFVRMLFEAATATPQLQWTVKLHNKDREEHYQCPEGSPRNLRIERGDRARNGLDIYDYLLGAVAAVTVSSTAAIDAMAAGVPVIKVDIHGTSSKAEYLDPSRTVHVSDAKGLAQAAIDAATDRINPEILRSADDYANDHFANRGRAADAVAAVLEDLAFGSRASLNRQPPAEVTRCS